MYRSAVSSTGDPVPRLRPRALLALFAAALAVAVVAAAGPSSSTTVADEPTPVAVTAGSLDWGVKGSFRRYVGEDGITASEGVTRTSGTTPFSYRCPGSPGRWSRGSSTRRTTASS